MNAKELRELVLTSQQQDAERYYAAMIDFCRRAAVDGQYHTPVIPIGGPRWEKHSAYVLKRLSDVGIVYVVSEAGDSIVMSWSET